MVASLAPEHGLQGTQASVVAPPRLESTGSGAVVQWLSCSKVCRIIPRPEMEPTSPALAGRFFTTEPPGKAKMLFLMWKDLNCN